MTTAPDVVQQARSLDARLFLLGDKLELDVPDDFPEEVVDLLRVHKSQVVDYLRNEAGGIGLAGLLSRLRNGSIWLQETHEHLVATGERYTRLEEKFLNAIDLFDGLDKLVRELYGYQDCILGSGQHCTEESPVSCRACAK